jgi:hypothetical protein
MLWAPAHAHIGPSVQENNRYVKLTVLGNRVRLLYTYYVGEVPGRQARRRMDADRDGALSADEAEDFGAKLAATVAASLELTIDDERIPLKWTSVDVGLGTPTTAGGAFSVDLVRWVCLTTPASSLQHRIELFDHWQPPRAGETEVHIEESPGVTVGRSTFGRDGRISQLRFKWAESRPPHPLDTDGLFVTFTVDPATADVTVAPSCDAVEPARDTSQGERSWLVYAALAGTLLALVAGCALLFVRKLRADG